MEPEERPTGIAEQKLAAAIVARVRGITRVMRMWAGIATLAGLWLWLLTVHAVTGTWFTARSVSLPILLLAIGPAVVVWLFYGSVRGLLNLPDALRELVREGRSQAGTIAQEVRRSEPRSGSRTALHVFRTILELRSLVMRGKGLLIAAGMALRLRAFNPLFLALLFAAFVASGAVVFAAVAATLLLLLF